MFLLIGTIWAIVFAVLWIAINKKPKGNLPPYFKGYPFLGALPIVLHYSQLLKVDQIFDKMLADLKSSIVYWDSPIFGMRCFVIAKAEVAKQVLSKPADFIRKEVFQLAHEGISKYSLFIIPQGETWKRHRKKLQPAFGPTHLRDAADITALVSRNLYEKTYKVMMNEGKLDAVNIYQHFGCLSVDVIGMVAFGYEFNLTTHIQNPDSPHLAPLINFEKVIKAISRRFSPRALWWIRGAAPSQVAEDVKVLKDRISSVIEKKKNWLANDKALHRSEKAHMDVLDRLLEDSNDPFSDDELADEVWAFFAAGHETTANTMTFMVYQLCTNPKILAKLRLEIDKVFVDGFKNLDQLTSLKYLDCIVKECQRYNPVIPLIVKIATRDQELAGFSVTEGSRMQICVSALHFSDDYWLDPHSFIPERWENDFIPVPGSYLPFGDGYKLALLEVKIAIALLFQKHDLELIAGQDLRPITSITKGLKNGLMVNIKARVF